MPRGQLAGLLVLGIFAITIWSIPRLGGASIDSMARLALLYLAVALFLVRSVSRTGWLSAPAIYLYVFAAFHLGLAPILALGWEVPDFGNPSATQWISNRPVGPALLAVAVAMLAYALGAWLGAKLPQPRGQAQPSSPRLREPNKEHRVATLALVVSLLGVLGWFALVISRGGLALLTGSYVQYLELTTGSLIPLIYLALGVTGALAAVAPSHPRSRVAIALLGLFALVALPMGIRGEVLFPLAAALAVIAKRRRIKLRPLRWMILLMILLSGIAMVRSVRSTGLAEVRGGIDANPVHGLAELGYSLRPVAEALDWQLRFDEPASGRTYLRPFERAVAKVVPSPGLPAASDDPYIMNALVVKRVGPIGFSPVAEGVINFGMAGAAGYMAVLGALLSWLDQRRANVSLLVLIGVTLVPLLIQTRNSFVPVPSHLAFGVLLWAWVVAPRGRRPLRASVAPRPSAAAGAPSAATTTPR